MAKSNKVKSDKFRELAHSRVNRAINMIRLIANLGNKAHYDYSTDQQKRIFAALENEVKNHHAYLTGSLNEPSGNHHIEGAQCGLPILYIDSGGIPEYCENYGLKFTENNFETILLLILPC